jgi:hypothetical protein
MDILPQEFRQGGDLAIGHARVRTKRKTLLQWHTFSKVPYTEASYSAYARELTFEDFCLCVCARMPGMRTHTQNAMLPRGVGLLLKTAPTA